jgi:hypothetical protein
MTVQVFIDESHRKSKYLLIAAFIQSTDLNRLRHSLRGVTEKPGQTIHMTKASNQIRLRLCSLIVQQQIDCLVIEHSYPSSTQLEGRMACLRKLCDETRVQLASHMTLDFSTTAQQDCHIFEEHRRRNQSHFPIYQHTPSRNEPLLWVPDAIGWCWGRGSHWKQLIGPCVTSHVRA